MFEPAIWPILDEDGTTATHMRNVGIDYERQRRRLITSYAEIAQREEAIPYGMRVHRAVVAAREEREFYQRVPLTDSDRGLVHMVLWGSPAAFREIVQRLNGNLGRRQTWRALQSLRSRDAVLDEKRPLPNGKTARFYIAVIPRGSDASA